MEKEIATPVFLPGKSHEQRSLASYRSMGSQRVGHDLGIKQQREREDCGKAGPPGSFLFLLLTCMEVILFCVVIIIMYFWFLHFFCFISQ